MKITIILYLLLSVYGNKNCDYCMNQITKPCLVSNKCFGLQFDLEIAGFIGKKSGKLTKGQ